MNWRRLAVLLAAFITAFGLGWLVSTARAGILSYTETNWPLELLKLFLPPILIGLTVLLGAWLAYHFANRGRKEDIVYKERYKSFEEVAGFLYEIKRHCESYLHRGTPGHRELPSCVPQLASKVFNDLSLILERQPNRRHLVLLSNDTRTYYYLTIQKLEAAAKYVGEYIPSQSEHYSLSASIQHNMAGVHLGEALVLIRKLLEEVDKTINSAFVDLDLLRK